MGKKSKIVIIGAGSAIFTKTILCDLLSFDDIEIENISLVDINVQKLQVVKKMTEKMLAQVGWNTTVDVADNWEQVLPGAEFVINTIAVGGVEIYQRDLEIADKYKVSEAVGDIIGPTGIFRMLRAYPTILKMVKDMERLCPDAYFFNYTNPMAPICQALSKETSIKVFGFCHSVQGTAKMLAEYLDVKPESMSYWCAGINHMAWYLQLKSEGKDVYPRLKEIAKSKEAIAEACTREERYHQHVGNEFNDGVRFEIMKYFDYYNSESPFHMSEYVPYFRKTPEMIKEWHVSKRWWLEHELSNDDYYDELKKQVESDEEIPMPKGEEYAPNIIHAILTGKIFRANLNVMNTGLVTSFPNDCCVEVPCYADAEGIHTCYVGELPEALAGLNLTNINVHRLMSKAAVTRKKQYIYEAIQLDPLTAAMCTLEQIHDLTDELISNNYEYLSDFS